MRTGLRAEVLKRDPNELRDYVLDQLSAQSEARDEAGLEPIDIVNVAGEFASKAKQLGNFVTDTVFLLNRELSRNIKPNILAEGAQAYLLDIDHGASPFTSSTAATSAGAATGLGISPKHIDKVFGVVKAVQSHVGEGPFPTEITDETLLQSLHGDMQTIDAEKGTTTGRVRRLGALDLPQIQRAIWVNGITQSDGIFLTKLDWLNRFGGEIPVCTSYVRQKAAGDVKKLLRVAPDAAYKLAQCEPLYQCMPGWDEDISDVRHFRDLPPNAQKYVEFIEKRLSVPVRMIGVGPRRDQVVARYS
jgi:adenylosuccinate synthase